MISYIELFIEANFVHSNYRAHRWGFRKKYNQKKKKKSADQFEVKPPREKYRLKFIKLKLARLQIFRN